MAPARPAPELAWLAPERLKRLPPHAPGMRIGLFGGSFNPPHAGHALVCALALRRLRLDRVWLMVSPGNPLKDLKDLPSLESRMAAARGLSRDPRVVVTGFEAALGARFSYETVNFLHSSCPGVNFVWIMGADNLASFFRWRRWRDIARKMPILVVDRPGSTHRAVHGLSGGWFERYRLRESAAATLSLCRPPAMVVLHGPRSSLSSTKLRAEGLRPTAFISAPGPR